jgi:hypothetical protein
MSCDAGGKDDSGSIRHICASRSANPSASRSSRTRAAIGNSSDLISIPGEGGLSANAAAPQSDLKAWYEIAREAASINTSASPRGGASVVTRSSCRASDMIPWGKAVRSRDGTAAFGNGTAMVR